MKLCFLIMFFDYIVVRRQIMKKNPVFFGLLVCFCLLGVFAACSSDVQSYGNSIKVVNVNAKELLSPYGEQDPSAEKAAKGANDFTFRLSAELVKNAGNGNFVCSPYSAWLPLAALVNATDAQNKAALLKALGASGITEADINRASSRMLYSLTKGDYNPLKIANAIFVDKNVTLKKDFVQTFMDYYRGSSINVDFSSRDAVDAVNSWASNNTNGLIKNVIQEFDPFTVAAIANAIYFSDRWSWEFDSGQTKEGVFHAPGKDTTASFMLRSGDAQPYYEDQKVQAMPLRFMTGGGLYIILPKTGNAAQLLSSMTNDYFNEILRNSGQATGKLLLPRFSIESTIDDLSKSLVALGVPLFDEVSAPLTGGLIEGGLRVWLSDAVQKAAIKVDEKGTTAAAVTVLGVNATAMPVPTTPFEMICDKPFVFILYGNTIDGGSQILFTGIVNQP
jgi:serine protease inhibitor